MNINGKEYVSKDSLPDYNQQIKELKSQNEWLKKILSCIVPIDEKEFYRYVNDGIEDPHDRKDKHVYYALYFGDVKFDDNARVEYEKKIRELSKENQKLRTQNTTLLRNVRCSDDGEVVFKQGEITALKNARDAINAILNEIK